MEVILYVSAPANDKLVDLNIMDVVTKNAYGFLFSKVEELTLEDELVCGYKLQIHHVTDAHALVGVLAARYNYITCLKWGAGTYTAVPTKDENGWEVGLADAMADHAGFIPGKHFRSTAFK